MKDVFQPKVEPTSKMLDILVSTDKNYIKKKLIECYYLIKYFPFRLWIRLGNRLKINGNSYTEMISELSKYKITNPTLGDKINDTLSTIERRRKRNITNLNKR